MPASELLYIENHGQEELAMSSKNAGSLRIVFNLLCGRDGNPPRANRRSPVVHARYPAHMGVDIGLYLGEGTRVHLRTPGGKTLANEVIQAPSIPPTFDAPEGNLIAEQARQAARSGEAKHDVHNICSSAFYAFEWGWLQGVADRPAAA